MDSTAEIIQTPWDSISLNRPTYEIKKINNNSISWIKQHPGHYTLRVDPLKPKGELEALGFYYCDTLIEPQCKKEDLKPIIEEIFDVKEVDDIDSITSICVDNFKHDRFHKDKHITASEADTRYVNWVCDIQKKGKILSLIYKSELVGFWAYKDESILLHALKKEKQGLGLSRGLWHKASSYMFQNHGFDFVKTSISASNLAILNIYASLGFKFKKAVDVYHYISKGD